MATLYSNVPTFRLTRTSKNINENTGDDDTWLKIIKKKNELAKVEIMNRSLINTSTSPVTFVYEIGFPQFTLSTTNTWKQPQSPDIVDISGNDNIIIIFKRTTNCSWWFFLTFCQPNN